MSGLLPDGCKTVDEALRWGEKIRAWIMSVSEGRSYEGLPPADQAYLKLHTVGRNTLPEYAYWRLRFHHERRDALRHQRQEIEQRVDRLALALRGLVDGRAHYYEEHPSWLFMLVDLDQFIPEAWEQARAALGETP